MQKRKLFVKAVSLIMAIIMTLAVVPVQAISLPQENEDISNEIVSTGNIETADQEVFIVEEDTSKRDQFEKHYLCSDGTYVSVTYPEAIHYLDDDNIWQDVDQSLTYNGASDVYSSDNADFNVSFAAKGSSSNIVRIEKDGYALSWGIQATGKTPLIVSDSAIDKSAKAMSADETIISIPTSLSSAKLVSSSIPEFDKNADRLITDEDSFVLPNISSQISYTNVFGGDQNVTLAYTVYHNKIEEDIIISERGDIHSVSMNMDIGTLTPVVNSDGSVDLVDDNNNMQFHVGIPYMVDAAFTVCNDIQVTAKKDGSNCIITYTPNAEWFDSADRVFPVLLDPSITTNDYIVNMVDTYVEENSTTNHSSEQYLYINKNGSNRRKAIIRLKKLPQIDASMPIVSATLSLTAQTAPTSSISLKVGYWDSVYELSEYTYNKASDIQFTYTTSNYLNSGSKKVTFDLSSHIYEMYSDLEFDIEEGYDYYGDFIISFSDNNNSTALAPFYSANYTTPANRPVFTVKYGYTLPSDMMNGGVYSFQNVGSYSYMTVSGNPPADKSNVIQVQNDSGVATASQKFKLVYSSSTGGYKLYSENTSAGSDLVLAILRNSTDIKPNRNVHVTSPGDPISDEWIIVPIDYYVFRIVPRANMSLALTVCGDQDGTSNGKTPTSPGNVFVATVDENEEYQEWFIYDSNDNDVTAEDSPSTMETGNYYISNKYAGRYLHRTSNLGNCMSGTISSLGDETVNWKVVNLGDGYCTIQRSDLAGYFLAATGTSSGSGVKVYQKTTGEIPDTYKWAITTASGGGCLIQNKASGYYLYAENQSANPSSVTVHSRYASGTDNYKRQVWRFAEENDYVELADASVRDFAIDINETKGASVNSSAHWATYEDFDYSIISGSGVVSYNANTHKFTGIGEGTAKIKATHKVTGKSNSFYISVDCFVKSLVNQGLVKATDICKTTDGFYMLTTPVSSILNEANIYELSETGTSSGKKRPVLAFYDDWYIYAIRNTTGYSYSLIKMREPEDDKINPDTYTDSDETGVTISFVGLDYNKLLSLINVNSLSNSYNFLQNLDQVTGPGSFLYDGTLADYFAKVESDAPYLIAELFIQLIVRETCVNGVISEQPTYISRLERIEQLTEWIADPWLDADTRLSFTQEKFHLERIPYALEDINEQAGCLVYDTSTNKIYISNPNNLTIYEKYVILSTHTANVNFYSFAAEVEFHADMLKTFIAIDFPFTDRDVYDSSLRADMAMGEEDESGFTDGYYDLNSDMVQTQAQYHEGY